MAKLETPVLQAPYGWAGYCRLARVDYEKQSPNKRQTPTNTLILPKCCQSSVTLDKNLSEAVALIS